jgi:DNA polymerase-1
MVSPLHPVLEPFKSVFANPKIEKVAHNLKFDVGVLLAHGIEVAGTVFDTMLAHYLVEPDRKHGMDALSEQFLGYTPIPISALIKDEGELFERTMRDVPVAEVAEYSGEDADVTWQLREILAPMLRERGQERVFYDIEMPLVRVLVDMESEGIAIDTKALAEFSIELQKTMTSLETSIHELAGGPFNLNSPKQLGEILFEKLNLDPEAKKTKTGQYQTNEQVLEALAPKHDIVRKMLDYREATKLKSTYVDALPLAVSKRTGRVHTHFSQTGAATGRLASNDPNLQNIPIRTQLGQEIRKAFIPRGPDFLLLSADYSQIELRVMAEVSGDPGMREAFAEGLDIHTATASRVYGTALENVTAEMRRTAKMVNFGIIYGISAFGLSQRLGIPRKDAAMIIDEYFKQYPGVKNYMDTTIASCRAKGYVETMTGRRRYFRDINSQNGTIRAGAERMAINTPIQGTAADMIKIAMSRISVAIRDAKLKSRLLLQVHDELVFDMHRDEEKEMRAHVEDGMKNAIPMTVPIVVELGTGVNWLAAH